MWLLKSPFDQNSIIINHKSNDDFNCHIIHSRTQIDLLKLLDKHAGTEALFADVGHFTVRSIQISMCSVTYPALMLAYIGQASFLRHNNNLVKDTFYESIPGKK
jgi:K+ transporter